MIGLRTSHGKIDSHLSTLRKLASETAIYGVSSIVGRFLNYLLVPLYTYHFSPAEYGVVSELYAYAGFFAVVLVFGLETGYFRFRDKDDGRAGDTAFATALRFVLTANAVFLLAIVALQLPIAGALRYPDHPEYILWFAIILVLDSAGAIPFARLRAENRAARFATIKLAEIGLTVALNLFFIVWCRHAYEVAPQSFLARFYDPAIGVGYIFIANLIASAFKWTLLLPQFRGLMSGFDRALFRRMIAYSLPMVVIGFAGIVNEMLDRVLLKFLLPHDLQTNLALLGIYSACYKLSILMSLFIQAFRYAGEPFFFAHAGRDDARQIYADVMKYFVIFCVFIFLVVTLYLDIFKYFIGSEFRSGLPVVPILLMANLCLGIYVNLSIWYKLTDHTGLGAWVAIGGAVLTVILNVLWIPILGYMGSAWATLVCYGAMAAVSYVLGRRYYPVRYDLRSISGYVILGIALYAGHDSLSVGTGLPTWASGSVLLAVYLLVVARFEFRQLRRAITGSPPP